jgi:hypothetical protein
MRTVGTTDFAIPNSVHLADLIPFQLPIVTAGEEHRNSNSISNYILSNTPVHHGHIISPFPSP